MALGTPGRHNEPLHVGLMALALVAAAFLGAALGLIWQSAGFGDDAEAEAEAAVEGG